MHAKTKKKALTHDRILEAAAKTLKEKGFRGTAVADVMRKAGLTHGGFYAHFSSRDAMLCEALDRAGQASRARIGKAPCAAAGRGTSPLRVLVDSYLAERHLRNVDRGCPIAALSSEIPRQSLAVRRRAAARLAGLVAEIERSLPQGWPAPTATIVASQMVGALQLAKVIGDATAARAHLAAVREHLAMAFDKPGPGWASSHDAPA